MTERIGIKEIPKYKTAKFYMDMKKSLEEKNNDNFTFSQLYLRAGEFISGDILWGKSPFDINQIFSKNLNEDNLAFWNVEIDEAISESYKDIPMILRKMIFFCKKRIEEGKVTNEYLLKTIIEMSAIIDFLNKSK